MILELAKPKILQFLSSTNL